MSDQPTSGTPDSTYHGAGTWHECRHPVSSSIGTEWVDAQLAAADALAGAVESGDALRIANALAKYREARR